ncbi:MAG: 2-C-methyl-D-erythritol 4-phosphate cytidylyltransferase [Ignavibacteriae bacterium]|nr:2-C-methyl-D-erythritol 4-phosphate cytidylyltransferase [Ignavibacteriota bacterium]
MHAQPSPFSVCIPSGGTGTRVGAGIPKQYLPLGGKPVLVRTVDVFVGMEECLDIVIAADDVERCNDVMRQYGFGDRVRVVAGGERRQDSVSRAVETLGESDGIVLIHDAARPLITSGQIRAVVAAITQYGAALLALPARDTIKYVEQLGGAITRTLDRKSIWLAQTPQGTRINVMRRALDAALKEAYSGTDDAELLERLGLSVYPVEGSTRNIKLTTAGDFEIAAALLAISGINE